jgi:YARHG domain/Domain of unknown function (DUF4424)
MKLRLNFSTLMCFICLALYANDGAYRSIGGIIYPMSETRISLEKEILSFNVNDKVAQVNIYFEFINTEAFDRKMLFGFQAPFPSGDAYPVFSPKYQISNFRIIYEGAILPYSVKVAECQDCELKDSSALKLSADGEYHGVFVYLFEVIFKPGKNIINHSYDFPASSNVMFNEIYRYILTTGSKWAGGSIKDFTLQVDLGKESYFYINDVFPKDATWTIIGTGKIGELNSKRSYWTHRMVRIVSGKLQITAKDFSPKGNIDFGIPGLYSYYNSNFSEPNYLEGCLLTANFLSFDFSRKTEFTKNDFLILRNAVYAIHGYRFKNQDLLKYFSKFEWYIPDPNITSEEIKLNDREQKFLDQVVQLSK